MDLQITALCLEIKQQTSQAGGFFFLSQFAQAEHLHPQYPCWLEGCGHAVQYAGMSVQDAGTLQRHRMKNLRQKENE